MGILELFELARQKGWDVVHRSPWDVTIWDPAERLLVFYVFVDEHEVAETFCLGRNDLIDIVARLEELRVL